MNIKADSSQLDSPFTEVEIQRQIKGTRLEMDEVWNYHRKTATSYLFHALVQLDTAIQIRCKSRWYPAEAATSEKLITEACQACYGAGISRDNLHEFIRKCVNMHLAIYGCITEGGSNFTSSQTILENDSSLTTDQAANGTAIDSANTTIALCGSAIASLKALQQKLTSL